VSVRADRPGDQRDAHFRIRLNPTLCPINRWLLS
jgi:hypothetical protein